jgi:integrase
MKPVEAIGQEAKPKHAPRKQRLTELAVRRTKAAGGRRAVVWDTEQRKLALRIQPSGSRSWVVVYSRHGRPRWLTLGSADTIGLEDARKKAREALVKVDNGEDPAAVKAAERSADTFAELAAAYVEEYAKKKNKSWKQAEKLIAAYVLPRWRNLKITSITNADVEAIMSKLADRESLSNQVLAAISAVFTWAKDKRQPMTLRLPATFAHPARGIERHELKSRERVLNDSEVARFWDAFGELDPVTGAALKMVLLTGQRPGEVAHMRREHLRDGWWELPGAPVPSLGWPGTKNKVSHRVWMAGPARTLIDGEDSTGFVFGRRKYPVHGLDAAMRSICTKLGVERATPHDLRRTFSTKVAALGFGREALNRVTNHKEGGIASVYDRHGYADENKRIMETVAAKLIALAEGRPDTNVVAFAR